MWPVDLVFSKGDIIKIKCFMLSKNTDSITVYHEFHYPGMFLPVNNMFYQQQSMIQHNQERSNSHNKTPIPPQKQPVPNKHPDNVPQFTPPFVSTHNPLQIINPSHYQHKPTSSISHQISQ